MVSRLYDVMIKSLPLYERKSTVFQEIIKVEGQQFTVLHAHVNDIQSQLNVDTATWGLAFYEKELNITTDLNKSLEERRSVVKSKMRGHGKVDAALIKLVVDAYTNGDVEVTFDGKINVRFVSVRGVPTNLNDVYKSVEDIKPAHLDVTYIFLYTTWDRFGSFNLTWDEFDALNKTWDEVEVM